MRVDNVIFNTVVRVGKASFGNIFYDINLEVDTILPHASSASEKLKNVSTSDDNIPQINGVVNNYDMQNSENDALENELNFARENALGIEESENDTKKMKLAKRVMRALNERYGINFKIYSGSEDSFINGFYENGTVYINQNADKPMLSVIGHEFLHGFKDIDAEGFSLLKSRTESDLSLKDYNRYKNALLNDYKENGIDISELSETELNDKILEEAMSDLMGEIINDPETIRKIALEDKNLAERIMAYLGEFIDKIRSLFSENDVEIQSLVHNYEQLKAVYQEVVAQSDGRIDGNISPNGNSATYLSTSSKNLANESNSEYNEDTRDTLNEEKTTYTEQEYQAFGWARENDILTSGQNADYRSKFAMAESGQAKFQKSKNGEYIIPVSDIYDSTFEGVNNVLVYAKGTIDNPVITSVIQVFEYDETVLADIRRYIYGLERRGISTKSGQVIQRYYAFDFADGYKSKNIENSRDNNDNRYGRGYSEETSKAERGNVSSSPENSTENNISNTEHNKIEDGLSPSSLNSSGVKLSVRKGSRAEKAQTAMAIYEESGNVADLPTRSWTREFYNASHNTEKMLENQIATAEWDKKGDVHFLSTL